jgi:hypothetical protein
MFCEAPDVVRAGMVERDARRWPPDVSLRASLDGQLAKRPAVVLPASCPLHPGREPRIEVRRIATVPVVANRVIPHRGQLVPVGVQDGEPKSRGANQRVERGQ